MSVVCMAHLLSGAPTLEGASNRPTTAGSWTANGAQRSAERAKGERPGSGLSRASMELFWLRAAGGAALVFLARLRFVVRDPLAHHLLCAVALSVLLRRHLQVLLPLRHRLP